MTEGNGQSDDLIGVIKEAWSRKRRLGILGAFYGVPSVSAVSLLMMHEDDERTRSNRRDERSVERSHRALYELVEVCSEIDVDAAASNWLHSRINALPPEILDEVKAKISGYATALAARAFPDDEAAKNDLAEWLVSTIRGSKPARTPSRPNPDRSFEEVREEFTAVLTGLDPADADLGHRLDQVLTSIRRE